MLMSFGGLMLTIIVARLLGPVEYGVYGSLIGLLYFLTIPVATLDLIVTKSISSFSENKILGNTKAFLFYLWTKFGKLCLLMLPLILMLSFLIRDYLHIDNIISLWVLWFLVYLNVLTSIFTGVLKGMLKFNAVVINLLSSMAIRMVSSIVFIMWFIQGHLGGLFGVLVSLLGGIGLFCYQLRQVWLAKMVKVNISGLNLRKLGMAGLITTGAFSSMYSLDIVFVRHYLSGYESGLYVSLATAGKMIFFSISPIAIALLPIVSRKAKESFLARKDLLKLLGLTVAIGMCGIVGFSLFPEMIINTIFSSKFSESAQYLPAFGIVMFLYSLTNVLGSFLMALNRFRASIWILFGLGVEIVLLNIYHHTIWEVIWSLGLVFLALSLVLLVQSWYATEKNP
jgi:O-antigen/teichoic acid export membrane protein